MDLDIRHSSWLITLRAIQLIPESEDALLVSRMIIGTADTTAAGQEI